MQAKLIFLEILTRDPKKAQDFYGTLFGVQAFAKIPTDKVQSYQMPISADRIDLHVTQSPTKDPPRIVPYFAVDDLRRAIEYVQRAGGKLIVEPFAAHVPDQFYERFRAKAALRLDKVDPSVKISNRLGEVALMLDPDNNPIGLMELEEFVHYSYGFGRHRKPLSEEQIEDHMTALRLSQDLLFEEKPPERRP
jgi:predicted enzyme related to lactoylglutathione lyase